MKRETTWQIVGIASLILVLAIFIIFQSNITINTGFKDTTAILAFVSGTAIAIERIIEGFWTVLGGVIGTYWPLNAIRRQVDTMVDELDNSLQPFYDLAKETLDDTLAKSSLTQDQIKEIKVEIEKETARLQNRFEEIKKLAPDNQRVQLLTAAATQNVNFLYSKYKKYMPELEQSVHTAHTAINGLQDFLVTFKDNPGRRLISIYLGALMGLGFAALFGLDVFHALLESSEGGTSKGMVLTGLMIGLGSNPTHEIIRAIQEYKKTRKGGNIARPDLPTVVS